MNNSTNHSSRLDLLVPPPEGQYATSQQLKKAVEMFARAHGYRVSIRRSNPTKRFTLKCDRGGLYTSKHNADTKRRKSRLTNCPFLLNAKYSKNTEMWDLTVVNSTHNHEPSIYPSTCQKLTPQQVQDLQQQKQAEQTTTISQQWRKREEKIMLLTTAQQQVALNVVDALLDGMVKLQ